MIKTAKVTGRRTLRFGRMGEILRDVEQLDAAGSVEALGNWSAAQVVLHVTMLIERSIDGFDGVSVPFWLRWMGAALRSSALIRPMRPGFKAPRPMTPDPAVTWERALARLRKVTSRLDAGERMVCPSPVLGELVHEEWEQLHCRHAEMHLSFLRAAGEKPRAEG